MERLLPQVQPHYLRHLVLAQQNTFHRNFKQHRDIPQKMRRDEIIINLITYNYTQLASTWPPAIDTSR